MHFAGFDTLSPEPDREKFGPGDAASTLLPDCADASSGNPCRLWPCSIQGNGGASAPHLLSRSGSGSPVHGVRREEARLSEGAGGRAPE